MAAINSDFYVVGIGASAGGHQALYDFFENLDHPPGMAFIVIMHLAREHQSSLDKILSKYTRMKVCRINITELLQPNRVYVLPENKYVKIEDGCVVLVNRPRHEFLNIAIDYFFDSLGEQFKDKSIGIIFSGLGADGSKGIKSIEKNGGLVFVQSPESSAFDSMPYASINSDHPDYIATPADIAKNLCRLIELKRLTSGKENENSESFCASQKKSQRDQSEREPKSTAGSY